jgi:molecular chaperone DnaK
LNLELPQGTGDNYHFEQQRLFRSVAVIPVMKIRKTVGIDLGTTNSVIALVDPTDSAIITGQDEQGRKTFPSVVGYQSREQRPVVGVPAARLKGQATGPVSSVKRFMGLDREFAIGPDRLTPPHVSARILRWLREVLAGTLADPRYLLDSAIITMPAYFNHNQIEATRQAGELAGYEVVELLHEPTAAAIYYSWLLGHGDAHYLVYDLGGGTFDVSIIRKRFGDYEVLSVSGDPFLGGDDFDRLLASHLVQNSKLEGRSSKYAVEPGTLNFTRLVHVAEGIKIELSERERVARYIPGLFQDGQGATTDLEAEVDRAAFQRLIKAQVDRTIECCHEALKRARDKAGLRLSDVDYVVLVGGSSKIPLVRDTVLTAFCNPALAEHARCTEPLLHEPDLCVAYGAALRAATYGVRYQVPIADCEIELHLTSSPNVQEIAHQIIGCVRPVGVPSGTGANLQSAICNLQSVILDGGSVRIQSLATGLVEEAFLEPQAAHQPEALARETGSLANASGWCVAVFEQKVELLANQDNAFHLTLCDPSGRELCRAAHTVRHQSQGRPLGQGVLPTQLITKPLQIQLLNRARQRIKQVLAPVGAGLPGTFACTCRTVDQSGQIVVPIFEENRLIKQLVIDHVDPGLPLGSPVEVEFRIDVKHNIQVRVVIRGSNREGQGTREESVTTAYIEAPPPPTRPTREEIQQVGKEIEELLREFSGSFRTRMAAQSRRLLQDLNEALAYDDEPKAIQRMAELGDLLGQLQVQRTQILDPPWPRFAQLVKQCLRQAGAVADRTGRVREELFEQVYAQERYAERAYEDKNQTLYRECFENLGQFAGYLDRLLNDALPRHHCPAPQKPEDEARDEVERCQAYLAAVTEKARARARTDLQERLAVLAKQGHTLPDRLGADPVGVIREARRLITEIAKVEDEITGPRRETAPGTAGLLGQ